MSKKNHVRLLIYPGLLITLLFVVFPMIQVFYPTLTIGHGFGHLYFQFFQTALNCKVLLRTLEISVITTGIVLLISLILSFWISRQKDKIKSIALLIILFPMLTNEVVLNFTWTVLLSQNGLINKLLLALHIIERPLTILYTNTAIVIGSVYIFIPIMVVSLLSSFSDLDLNLEKAAEILGANKLTIFDHIIIPQILPGILTGVIWTFSWVMTSYTTPAVLGGTKDMVLSTLIYQDAMNNQNWTEASVIAFILVAFSLLSLGLIKLIVKVLERRSYHV